MLPGDNGIPQLIPGFECLKPPLNSNAPPTSIRQSPESMLEAWGNQVITTSPSEFQELFCDDGSDCVWIRIEGGIITVPESHEAYPRRKIPQTSTDNYPLVKLHGKWRWIKWNVPLSGGIGAGTAGIRAWIGPSFRFFTKKGTLSTTLCRFVVILNEWRTFSRAQNAYAY